MEFPIFDFLQVLDLDKMVHFELGKFLYRINHSLIPAHCLGNYFEVDPFVNNHSYGLRSRTSYAPTRLLCQTKFSEKSLQIAGAKFWKKIPQDIQNSDSLKIFKKSFKAFLLECHTDDEESFFWPCIYN